jgi:pimeloyl-ACP methyl ester carboxylesterase
VTWVLLRGLTREARHWGLLPEQLAKSLDGEQILTLDLPGNGEFCAMPSPSSVQGMVEFARSQLLAKGLRPPYAFVAMSLGGMVATHWAQQHPREVRRLVLINTSMRPFNHLTERLRPGNLLQLTLLALRWHNALYCEQVIHQLTCKQRNTRDEDVAAWVRIRSSAPVSAANAWRQLRAAALFSSAAAAPSCPVLVLSSAGDRLVDPRCSARLAAIWRVPHHQHLWAGHDLPHDDAAWVCERMAQWLRPGQLPYLA